MSFDDSVSPYNDPFNPDKRFSRILFNPGVPAFNWEMNELQSMQQYGMQMLGDTLSRRGYLIRYGCHT